MYNPYQQQQPPPQQPYGGPPQYPQHQYGPPQHQYGPGGYNHGSPPPQQGYGPGINYQHHQPGHQQGQYPMSAGPGGWQGYGPEQYYNQSPQVPGPGYGPPQGMHGVNGFSERPPPRRPHLSTAPGPPTTPGHEPEECYNCGSIAHMAQHCPEPKRGIPHGASKRRSFKSGSVHRQGSFVAPSPISPYPMQSAHSAGPLGPPQSPFGGPGSVQSFSQSAGPHYGSMPFGNQASHFPQNQDYPQPPHSAPISNFNQFSGPPALSTPRPQAPPSQARSSEPGTPGTGQGGMLNPFTPHPQAHLHGQYGGSIGGPTPSFQYRPHKALQTPYDPAEDFEILSQAPVNEFYPDTKEPAKPVGRPLRSNVLLSRDNTPSPVHGDQGGETVSKYIYANGPGSSPRSIRNTSTWEKVKNDPAYGRLQIEGKMISFAELRSVNRVRLVPQLRRVSTKGDGKSDPKAKVVTPAAPPLKKHDSTKVLLERLQARGVARVTAVNGKRPAEDDAEQDKTKAAKLEVGSKSPELTKKALTEHVTNGETPKRVLMEKTAAWIQAQNTETNGVGHNELERDVTPAATPPPMPPSAHEAEEGKTEDGEMKEAADAGLLEEPEPVGALETVDVTADEAKAETPETSKQKTRKKNALIKQKEEEEAEKQMLKEEAMITRAKAKKKAAVPKVQAAYSRRW